MIDLLAKTCAFGLIGIAVLMCVWLMFGPVEDQEHDEQLENRPCARPTCWCFVPTVPCSCTSFEDGER
ncbi:hypothetical protein H4W33_007080 [Kibdelosporangium phytohabitans]|uniref:Uncharacterized protein n=1 Tax=Kibdelosporangium phytohabitans TaxID=860235 RepID=A0A0N9HQ67_9PSEU|nr:hypothetical protein AOZ06_07680 [Kibdelosporangium phytohabitans]MBE1468068.1 hypothetical protein [Kibdelosporangium phytohabitans]